MVQKHVLKNIGLWLRELNATLKDIPELVNRLLKSWNQGNEGR